MWCIVVAGGSGVRFGRPKQYLDLSGVRVIDRAVSTASAVCDGVVVVVPEADVDAESGRRDAIVVAGGATRSESVRRGLDAVPVSADVILVHDAARPLAAVDLFERVITAVDQGALAAVPVVAPVDTLRLLDGGTVDRDSLRIVQTPQGFSSEVLRDAHSSGAEGTDDASLVEALGHPVTLVEGQRSNLKITEPLDLVIARVLLEEDPEAGTLDRRTNGDGTNGHETDDHGRDGRGG